MGIIISNKNPIILKLDQKQRTTNMTSTVGQYTLGRTLGSGFSAKVKLGTD